MSESENPEIPLSVKQAKEDEILKEAALQAAQDIHKVMGDKWFTVSQLRVPLKLGFHDTTQKLNALKLFNVIHEKERDGAEIEYKVVFNDAQKKKLIENDIKFYEQKIVILKKEVAKLEEKIKMNIN